MSEGYKMSSKSRRKMRDEKGRSVKFEMKYWRIGKTPKETKYIYIKT